MADRGGFQGTGPNGPDFPLSGKLPRSLKKFNPPVLP